MENPSLEQLSALAGLSQYHLVRVFRQETGLPPHTYLTQTRIERAKEQLQAGEPIAAVAATTGFADQSHFTKRFKRIVGVTPGQYIARI
jgi:AraC-like DNA-binding protein